MPGTFPVSGPLGLCSLTRPIAGVSLNEPVVDDVFGCYSDILGLLVMITTLVTTTETTIVQGIVVEAVVMVAVVCRKQEPCQQRQHSKQPHFHTASFPLKSIAQLQRGVV